MGQLISIFYRFFNCEIKGTIRYQRINQNLNSELTLPYLAFVSFIVQDFEAFLVIFQSIEPLVHLLHERMANLLTKLMAKFIRKKYLFEKKDGEFIAKSLPSSINIDIANSNFHKEVNTVDIGTKAKSCFAENFIPDEKLLGFKKECVAFCATASQYLIENMPFEVNLLKDVQFIPPLKKNDPRVKIIEVLGSRFYLIFNINSNVTKEELCDIVRSRC